MHPRHSPSRRAPTTPCRTNHISPMGSNGLLKPAESPPKRLLPVSQRAPHLAPVSLPPGASCRQRLQSVPGTSGIQVECELEQSWPTSQFQRLSPTFPTELGQTCCKGGGVTLDLPQEILPWGAAHVKTWQPRKWQPDGQQLRFVKPRLLSFRCQLGKGHLGHSHGKLGV